MTTTIDSTYLTGMPTDILNEFGLSKTLLTRRETIFMKHVMKNIFVYGNEEELNKKLERLQFKSMFDYFAFATNKLRGIYKLPREYEVDDVDKIVKQNRGSFCKNLDIYKGTQPIVVLDFDKTITNPKFHSLYKYLMNERYRVIINSANPSLETIHNYLDKHELKRPNLICANKGKKKKISKLKDIAYKNFGKIIFYIDDEQEYLDYASLLFMHTYLYTGSGKLYSRTIFEK
ncbi:MULTISPECIES: hypothetical protein [Lysinibacillus]|uniref:hypothetical protein n=1 Tax=Lysinibacillus TaxID=400634 RepID=UPI00214B2CBE|nr:MULTISPECIES: hypothetical protein [Lysinibacillus]UUV25938.1 hypothetical protein NP781_04780 [Lysinibacillus sp. FN11]UYB48811.1 hypothetical protein OCI51_07570 [Lysinibacillus capsici]